MLYCVTQENNYYLPSNLLISQHLLRHQAIIERQAWDVPTFQSMEYDQFDNLAATYIIWSDTQGVARGTARLCTTARPYMLKEVFSHLVDGELPSTDKILEGSRFCVDKTMHPNVRQKIQRELVYGYLEYALAHNCKAIIGVMHPVYWRGLFAKNGWPVEPLGHVHKVDDGKDALAGSLNITVHTLADVQRATGIQGPLLHYPEHVQKVRANVRT
jgi:N-acyl-L-homoserine lactone synthetase